MTKDLFLSFFELSVSTGFIVFFLLLLKPLLNRQYTAKWNYYLWIALAFRLIIPFHVRLSILPLEINVPAQITSPLITNETAAIPINIRSELKLTEYTFLDFIAVIWLIVCISILLFSISAYVYYKIQIHKKGIFVKDPRILSQFYELKSDLQIKRKIAIVKFKTAESPMIIGYFRPLLVIPDQEYSNDEIFFILKHELIHFKRHDTFFKFLFVIANALHWYNPLIFVMQKEAIVDMELSCDEEVIQGKAYIVRKKYTETLLSTLHKHHKSVNSFTTQFYGGKQIMKKRFRNILTETKKKNGFFFFVCAISMTLLLGAITGCSLTEQNSLEPRTEEQETVVSEPLPVPEESISYDEQEIKRVAEEFLTAYFNKDTDKIQNFLSDPFEWDIEVYSGTGTISNISLKGLSDLGGKENGSVQVISVEYMDSNIGDSYRYLTLEFIKQDNEWKIQFYGIEG